MALCVGIIGAENQPLLIKISSSIQDPIKFHHILHSSLDVIEEKTQPSMRTPGAVSAVELRDLYLGHLYPSSADEYRVYGYCSNTKVKFILIIDSSNTVLKENDIRTAFRKLHVAYSNIIMNPFYEIGNPITSKAFHDFIETFITTV